jgi:hypothetical protein
VFGGTERFRIETLDEIGYLPNAFDNKISIVVKEVP